VIDSAAVGAGHRPAGPARQLAGLVADKARRGDVRPVAAWVLALSLFFVYAGMQAGTLSRAQIGDICKESLPLAIVALGQGIVILTAGIDLSVGGVFALGNCLAATHFTHTSTSLGWSVVVLAIGAAAGALNGLFVGVLGLQPFIVTLATWSIYDGIALYVLPAAGGSVPTGFSNWINDSTAGLPNPIWALIVLVALWEWFKRTTPARRIYAAGSDREGARIAGVRLGRTLTLAYALSGLCAALASLAYSMLTTSGDPTAGDQQILYSVAAVVIGGAALYGGQGGFVGTVAGALVLTLLGDVIFVLNLSSYWTTFAAGLLLVVAVLAGGGLQRLQARYVRSR
jgi:ribose transport system permease protein